MAHNANHYDISTPQEFSAILKQSRLRTVIRFYRPGCPACDASTGQWLNLVRDPKNVGTSFISAEVTDNSALARAMNVERIPTFISLERGRPAVILEGADSAQLTKLVNSGAL